MLKFVGSIKLKCLTISLLTTVLFDFEARATDPEGDYNFIASARLKSPDRNFETSTREMLVQLDGSQSVTLRGKTLSVTLESEPSGFAKAQMIRVSANGSTGASGNSAAFSAGMFKVSDNGEHNFLFVEKSRGWLLEIKLRPVDERKGHPSKSSPSGNRPPNREWQRKKTKRLPA
ncbi:MAG: hypothetical protein RLZZ488_1319 [Pseudomonadota bacterium]|jgi:hypothetical protein